MSEAYSAPGKALLAGGFLVLDPQYPSYVTALSSRMHAIISEKPNSGATTSSISIRSPQFGGAWDYEFKNNDHRSINDVEGRKNPFIEATIKTVLAYVSPTTSFNVNISIYSDPGYHSQDNTEVKQSSNKAKKFLFHKSPIEKVAKTGLGSSAGLVSVLTTTLLSHFQKSEASDLTLGDRKKIIHNTAQIAHCYAQRKVGSGFDVAAAIFGSISYQRFSPHILTDLFENDEDFVNVKDLIEQDWEFSANPVALPPRIRLVMGDIKGGSETPKLVSKVLNWKKSDVVASDELYKNLNNANISFIEALKSLHKLYEDNKDLYNKYANELNQTSINSEKNTDNLGPFTSLIQAIQVIRENLRKLTKFSGAEIEPIEQTELLDNCNSIAGVLGGVVPGAGGYDAICLLVIEDSVKNVVKNDDENLKSVTWLDLEEEADGVIQEDPRDYEGL